MPFQMCVFANIATWQCRKISCLGGLTCGGPRSRWWSSYSGRASTSTTSWTRATRWRWSRAGQRGETHEFWLDRVLFARARAYSLIMQAAKRANEQFAVFCSFNIVVTRPAGVSCSTKQPIWRVLQSSGPVAKRAQFYRNRVMAISFFFTDSCNGMAVICSRNRCAKQ